MDFKKLLTFSLLSTALLAGCDPKKDIAVPVATETGSVFVVNEGAFTQGNGTVSLFNKADKTVANDLFGRVNGRPLGDVAQSMAVAGNRGYLVVNNSKKIEVVSLPDFRSVGVVRGLVSPRYLLPISPTRAYVTQWGRDTFSIKPAGQPRVYYAKVRPGIKVIDLNTFAVIDSIATGLRPERLVLAGGKVYVANSGSNTLTVIDPTTNAVTSTLPVADAPNSFALDKNGLLWVLCGGAVAYNPDYSVNYASTTPGQLVSVNAGTATVVSARTFATNRLQPTDLQKNQAGDQLLFRATDAFTSLGAVCRLGIADASLPSLTAPFIRRAFYGLGVDPKTDVVYGGTGAFLGTDKLIRYQSSGVALDSATVGIGPNGFVFY